MHHERELMPEQLRRRCDPAQFSFTTTAALGPLGKVIGQERAVKAIDFGVDMPSYGYNIYAMGPAGSGRTTAVRQYLDARARQRPAPNEWCYVYDFEDPRRPRALSLPAGRASALRKQMDALVARLQLEIPRAFEGQPYEQRRRDLVMQLQQQQQVLFQGLEVYLNQRGFALIRSQSGLGIAPMKDGEVLTPEAYQKLDAEEKKRYETYRAELQEQYDRVMREARELDRQGRQAIEAINNELAGFVVDNALAELREAFADCPKVTAYLDAARADVVGNAQQFLPSAEEGSAPASPLPSADGERWRNRYKVNVLSEVSDCACAPVVVEDNPTYHNLIGRIEHRAEFGTMVTDFTQIRPGALHRANGGYLVVEAKDLLANALAWEALKRALRNREIIIEEMAQFYGLMAGSTLEAEPIPLEVKVVIIGDPALYGLLYTYDEDFRELFKVKAEFTLSMDRGDDAVDDYASFVGDLCRKEGLRHFSGAAVARLIEEASRMADDQGKLTTHFASVADLVREAAFWAGRGGREVVDAEDVGRAVDERLARINHVMERYVESVLNGVVLIDTAGAAVGQVNGLSVVQSGDLTFGVPSRITARTFLGRSAVVSIEREVKMSGPIHDKGQLILSGYLASRFAQRHPLTMSASLTFEQLYSGVEGDSASSTELYALLSSLSEAPVRQGLAVTGSVNQFGQVQAIGGVNYKIEGFFDVCRSRGLTGDQGVMIPASNVRHLMLRQDLVQAVAEGQFHIYAVSTIEQGIELLVGSPAGEADGAGRYPEGSVYARVQAKLDGYADLMRREPDRNGARPASDEAPAAVPAEPAAGH